MGPESSRTRPVSLCSREGTQLPYYMMQTCQWGRDKPEVLQLFTGGGQCQLSALGDPRPHEKLWYIQPGLRRCY
jgi:hypothetical protein